MLPFQIVIVPGLKWQRSSYYSNKSNR